MGITVFQAIRRARQQSRLAWALFLIPGVLVVVAAIKFVYADAYVHAGEALTNYLYAGIRWLYAHAPPLRWSWPLAPTPSFRIDPTVGWRSLITLGNLYLAALVGLVALGVSLRQAAAALRRLIDEVFAEHQKEQWRDQLRGRPLPEPVNGLMQVTIQVGHQEQWWQRPAGIFALGLLVTVLGGLLVEWLK